MDGCSLIQICDTRKKSGTTDKSDTTLEDHHILLCLRSSIVIIISTVATLRSTLVDDSICITIGQISRVAMLRSTRWDCCWDVVIFSRIDDEELLQIFQHRI